MPGPRRFFAPEYNAEVELTRTTGKTVGQVARELDLTETAVRKWVKRADLDAGWRTNGLTSAERDELRRLRREVRDLREDREILRTPRVHAELRLGMDVHVGRRRVARLMGDDGLQGVHRRRRHGSTSRLGRTGCGRPTAPSSVPARAGGTSR